MKQDYFRIGVFTSTHGVHGEINVYPTTDDNKRFDDLKSVFFDTPSGFERFEIDGVKYFKNMVILKIKGIDSIEDAIAYKGKDIYVSREDAIPLNEGEYYVADLIGLSVEDDTGKALGKLKDVLQTGANDVYVVETDGKDLLIPAIKECILDINIENETIKVHLLEGLLDL